MKLTHLQNFWECSYGKIKHSENILYRIIEKNNGFLVYIW